MKAPISMRPAPTRLTLPQSTIGVGTEGNVGLWNGTGWTDQGLMGGWTLKMTAFDQGGVQWGVGTLGNVGWWNGQSWIDFGPPGGWTLDWVLFS